MTSMSDVYDNVIFVLSRLATLMKTYNDKMVHERDHPKDYVKTHQWSRPDYIEIGTPSKGGVMKIHFDITNPEETEALIISAEKKMRLAKKLRGEPDGK